MIATHQILAHVCIVAVRLVGLRLFTVLLMTALKQIALIQLNAVVVLRGEVSVSSIHADIKIVYQFPLVVHIIAEHTINFLTLYMKEVSKMQMCPFCNKVYDESDYCR